MLMPANPFQRVFGEDARQRLRMAAAGRSARQQGNAPDLRLIVIRRAAKGKAPDGARDCAGLRIACVNRRVAIPVSKRLQRAWAPSP
jgi:hypothetical protein